MAACVARISPVRSIFAYQPPASPYSSLHRRVYQPVGAPCRPNSSAVKLAEVGKFEEPKIGKYATGQLFLHRIFGYRGVILFPWLARVFDRDLVNRKDVIKPVTEASSEKSTTASSSSTESSPQFHNIGTGRDVKGRTVPYYQVLIDSRDCPYVRAQTESVTFLGHQSETSRSLYAIPGLDYISHEDVLPYVSVERSPIFHELFDKFLHFDATKGQFEGKETLLAWQDRNHPWLELSDVHRETTENIRVTVIPFYMGCKKDSGQGGSQSIYWWRYCIRLENLGEQVLQLRERHWRIFSLSGTLETVRGRGVVGQEPVLSKSLPAFQYSSHVSLQAPSGHMWGTFRFEKDDGSSVDVKIPPFSLESKDDESTTYTVT